MAKHLLRLLKDRALEKLKDEGSLLQSYIHTRDSVGGLWIGKLGGVGLAGGGGRNGQLMNKKIRSDMPQKTGEMLANRFLFICRW